jgi:hypothetical protein
MMPVVNIPRIQERFFMAILPVARSTAKNAQKSGRQFGTILFRSDRAQTNREPRGHGGMCPTP